MQADHIAEARVQRYFAGWVHQLLARSPERLSMQLATSMVRLNPKQACRWKNGAFNVCYRVRFDDGIEVIVRFASLGQTILRKEKVENERFIMHYLRQNTAIPVPEVFGTGSMWTGPYIVMRFVDGVPLSEILKDRTAEGRPTLNLQISQRGLVRAYHEMAKILLELSKPGFSRIGSIAQDDSDGEFRVTKRPFTFNMNWLMTEANISPQEFPGPNQVYTTAASYFEALAMQQLSHFLNQRNDAFVDEADCRKKFIARCLFRKLIQQKVQFEHNHGPFRLYCDDLRPSNVLVDVQQVCISSVIDWEFTYVAPAEFSYVAPWWLLLQSPEDWEADLRQFLVRYTPRLHLFLDAMRAAEGDMITAGTLQESQRLSQRMEASLDNGLFWLCLAAKNSSLFDEVYWEFLDERYYGAFTTVEDRVEHLDTADRVKLDEIFQIKVEQAKIGEIDVHYTAEELIEL